MGVGLGAASLIDNVRYANTDDLAEYLKKAGAEQSVDYVALKAADIWPVASEALSRTAQMEEFMFLGLRMTDGIHRQEFVDAFGIEIEGVYGDVLHSLQNEGLLRKQEGRIALTDKGIDVSNYALAQFLLS